MMQNTSPLGLSRRALISSGTALLVLGLAAPVTLAQSMSVNIANRLADLAGVDVLPRDLLANLEHGLESEAINALEGDDPLDTALQHRVLTGLYSGVLPGATDDATARRIGFSSALMWGAIDRTNNVISYCGGVPHFWADPPEQA